MQACTPSACSEINYKHRFAVVEHVEEEAKHQDLGLLIAAFKLLRRNGKQFRGGLVFKVRRLVCHPTIGWREEI